MATKIVAAHCLSVCLLLCKLKPAATSNASIWTVFANEVGVPTALPIDGWRYDYRLGGGGMALDFERLAQMQRGDVRHGVSLGDEPFYMGSVAGQDKGGVFKGAKRFEIYLQGKK